MGPALQSFFDALQTASQQPASLPERRLVLGSAETLAQRFRDMQQRFEERVAEGDRAIEARMGTINEIAAAVADLNRSISQRQHRADDGGLNALLDERDERLRQLSSEVGIALTEQADGSINVSIGKGQPLVLGHEAVEMRFGAGEIILREGNVERPVGRLLPGGELGGLLRARNDLVEPTLRQLGLIAASVQQAMNEQHRLGLNLDGQLGTDLFGDINEPGLLPGRIERVSRFPTTGAGMEVRLADVEALELTSYEVEFLGNGSLRVRRDSDRSLVYQGEVGAFPATLEFDGLELELLGGGHSAGERFRLDPLTGVASGMSVAITDTAELALASPLRLEPGIGNQGTLTAAIDGVFDAGSPALAEGDLVPPLLVVFRTADRFDVLDNSDPGRPVPLEPPIVSQRFLVGGDNAVFPTEPGALRIEGDSQELGGAGEPQRVAPEALSGVAANYSGGTAVVVDEQGLEREIALPAGSSARDIADRLTAGSAVTATGRTAVNLTGLSSTSGGTSADVLIDGIAISVPAPPTLADLADAINANTDLAARGTQARSDGESLLLENIYGDDLLLAAPAGTRLSVLDDKGRSDTLEGATDSVEALRVSGTVSLVVPPGASVQAPSVLGGQPSTAPADFGFSLRLAGVPQAGDRMVVAFNGSGTVDNRNALALADVMLTTTVGTGGDGFGEAYSQVVQRIGVIGSEARLNASAAQALLDQSTADREAFSGVNLDEEAANLIRFEQAYNASAQVIATARDLFNSLINAVS